MAPHERRVEFGDRIEIDAKGFEGSESGYPVRSLLPRSSRRTIPFVDRRRELQLLRDTYERAIESQRGHMVTLFGEPGIGKSRVAEEFLSGLPVETQVLTGRASPFEEDVTFAPLAQMLMQQLGDRSDMPPEVLQERLRAMVAECCPDDEIEQVVARLGLALGIGEAPRSERRYRVAEIRSGLLALLTGLSRRGPVVLVFEDLHLAQPPLLELVEQVLREAKRIPLFVLCVARYDLLDDRPQWGGGLGDSLNLYLEAMSLEDATALALEAGEGLDEATADRIARHAGGNPFFIVETTGMLMHSGDALPSDTGPLPGPLLPPTVQAVIAARIDHLPAEARDLIRKASVFARSTFDMSELALITEPNEKVLAMLEDEELLVRDEERPDVWRFRHGLVRDVAYESLPKRERQRLHLLVADKLSEDPEVAARIPRSIAYHLEQAAKASLDLNPRDRAVADRAVEALTRAGDLALQTSEARPAADLFERALALTGPERGWGIREAHILAGLGEARYWLGDFESAVSPLTRSLELGGDEDASIRAHASRFLGDIELSVRGNRERAGELFDRAPGGRPRAGRTVDARAHLARGRVGAVLARRHGGRGGDVPGGARRRAVEPGRRPLGRGASARHARHDRLLRPGTRWTRWSSRPRPSRSASPRAIGSPCRWLAKGWGTRSAGSGGSRTPLRTWIARSSPSESSAPDGSSRAR